MSKLVILLYIWTFKNRNPYFIILGTETDFGFKIGSFRL